MILKSIFKTTSARGLNTTHSLEPLLMTTTDLHLSFPFSGFEQRDAMQKEATANGAVGRAQQQIRAVSW